MILDDYIADCERYRNQFGALALVLYQVGSFFELYAYPDPTGGEDGAMLGAEIHRIGNLLNIAVTKRNKGIPEVSRSNPYMAGIPLDALDKYTPVLLSNGYTIVLVRQVTDPPNPVRAVSEILSPGTQITPGQRDNSYLMSVHLDAFHDRNTGKRRFGMGVALMDISTGEVLVYEPRGTVGHLDEVVRLVQAYSPKEIVITHDPAVTDVERGELLGVLDTGIPSYVVPMEPEHARVAYQSLVFQRAWGGGILDPIEQIGVGRMALARLALVALLRFAFDHNEKLVRNLRIPRILSSEGLLTLEYTSAQQLQAIGSGSASGEQHLLALLNRCSTVFGGRLFRERLLHPLSDPVRIAQRYDAIAWLLEEDRWAAVQACLRGMHDLERMARRIQLGMFHPCDWPSLHDTLCAASRLGTVAADAETAPMALPMGDIAELAVRIRGGYEGTLNLDECARYTIGDIRGNVFVAGAYPELDAMAAAEQEQMDRIVEARDAISRAEPCTIDVNDRDGYSLLITKKRWESVRQKLGAAALSEYEARPVSHTASSSVRLTSPAIRDASARILANRTGLQREVGATYREWLTGFSSAVGALLTELAQMIAGVDVATACARNAHDFGYTRPEILTPTTADGSCGAMLGITGMRHPIIERIHERVPFVANDASFGGAAPRGMLLYGINASGKSSYMKAIGLNVMMAQAGMYVAARAMRYVPYRRLFTRIQGNDNLYRGMSTFTVEMTELRDILLRADSHSLVLGDELCSGTESVSGTAIVAAGIDHLLIAGASFLFATHLHELTTIPMISGFASQGQLRIAHIHVEIGESGELIYDRELRDGPGNPVYGLEVCRAIGLPPDFVRVANRIRRHLQGSVGPMPETGAVSRYNARVYVDVCAVCGGPATDTHHIQYQRDGGGNRASNLMPLCEACHTKEHNGTIQIQGYVATSEGVRASVLRSDPVQDTAADTCECECEIPEVLRKHVRFDVAGWLLRSTTRSKWRPEPDLGVVEELIRKKTGMREIDLAAIQKQLYALARLPVDKRNGNIRGKA